MEKLNCVVLQHQSWIEDRIPRDVVPPVKKINTVRQVMHNIIKKVIGIQVNKFITTQEFLWEHAIIIDGLITNYEIFNDNNVKKIIENYYINILKKTKKGYTAYSLTDQLMHCRNILWLIEKGEIQFKPLMDAGIDYLKNNINCYGFLAYSQNDKDVLYVDATGMICPFCVKYGIKYNDNKILEVGLNQLNYHIDNALDCSLKLPFHAVHLRLNKKLGSYSWGRGLGWMFYALSGVLENLPINNQFYDKFEKYYIYLSEYVVRNFSDGILYNDLVEKDHLDTSVIAMIGTSIALGVFNKILPLSYIDILKKFILEIDKYILDDGNILSCSKDCMGIGHTSKEYSRFCAGGPTIKLMSLVKCIEGEL